MRSELIDVSIKHFSASFLQIKTCNNNEKSMKQINGKKSKSKAIPKTISTTLQVNEGERKN
jgi:hypothetical protein